MKKKVVEKKDFEPMEKENNKKVIRKTGIIKDSTDVLLIIIFTALLVLTIFLSVKVFNMHNELKEHVRANIVIPILQSSTNNDISVDLKDLKKGKVKEYTFKISNYRGDIINQDVLNYLIEVVPNKNVEVEIYKNDSKEAITIDEDGKIKDNSLVGNEKQEDIYKLKIKALKNMKAKDLLTIKIAS